MKRVARWAREVVLTMAFVAAVLYVVSLAIL